MLRYEGLTGKCLNAEVLKKTRLKEKIGKIWDCKTRRLSPATCPEKS